MASSVQNPEDLINNALTRIGVKGRVSNLFDGSLQAKKALDIYGQARDMVLNMKPWGFAERIQTLASTAAAPFPWAYEFPYPADCIRIRSLFGPGYAVDPNNPLPFNHTVANVAAEGVTGKVIWAKVAPITIVYTAQITNPALWDDSSFVEILIGTLAKQLAPVVADLNAAKMAMEDEKMAMQIAQDDDE